MVNGKFQVYTENESFLDTTHSDIQVLSYQDTEQDIIKRVAPHSHTYYEIIWMEKGSGCHLIDFAQYKFQGPCIFLLHPRNIHCIKKNAASAGGVIKFSESFFLRSSDLGNFLMSYNVFDDVSVKPFLELTQELSDSFSVVFNELVKNFKTKTTASNEILHYYLRIFLLKVYELKVGHPSCKPQLSLERERFNKFKILLENSFHEHHDVTFYMDKLNVSEKTLRNTTNLLGGRSPSTLIHERILLEARRLLFHTPKSVKEIATDLGYEASYFTRFFTKGVGMSPNAFREKGEYI